MTKLPPIDAETRAAIREGLAQADRGEFVPDEIVAESDRRHGIALSDKQAEPNPKTPTMTEFRAIAQARSLNDVLPSPHWLIAP